MATSLEFTRNTSGEPVMIVVAKITHFERDDFSECTTIYLEGGATVAVSESMDTVQQAVDDA